MLVSKIDVTRILIDCVEDFATRAGKFCLSRSFSCHFKRWNFFLKLQSSVQNIQWLTRARSKFFFSDCSAKQLSMVQFVRACVRLRWCSRIVCGYRLYTTKDGFTRHKDRASLLHEHECFFVRSAHTRTRSFAPSCAREFTSCVLLARNRSILILVRFTADRRWGIVSYVSIGISSLPRAPISSSARPSFPSAPPFPPPSSPPRSLFLSHSFALSL